MVVDGDWIWWSGHTAICLKCHHPMNQTEAICPNCGENYLDVQPGPEAFQPNKESKKESLEVERLDQNDE